jgi:hypothetical protein
MRTWIGTTLSPCRRSWPGCGAIWLPGRAGRTTAPALVPAVVAGVRGSMDGYNTPRLHQRLAYRTPAAVYGAG